jgi:hypothetical protein
MARESFLHTDGIPSAIISDGLVTIPIYGVSQISLSEAYHLPPIGTSGVRTTVATHDDTVSLTGVLVGEERFAEKFALEQLAESSKRGSALEGFTHGAVAGLILITGMTVRTDLQVETLSFTASAGRRDVIDVSITMLHMPRPNAVTTLLALGSVAVSTLRDFGGR